MIPAALTRWTVGSDSIIRVALYGSPDASYIARLAVRDGRIHGRGVSSEPGPGVRREWVDSVAGARVGNPDRAFCIRAIETQAAREHDERTRRRSKPPIQRP